MSNHVYYFASLQVKVSQQKSRQDDEPKIKFKKRKFRVGIIVYVGKQRKKLKTEFWIWGSVTCRKNVSNSCTLHASLK